MPTNSFLGVFAKSPLKPFEDHIDLVDQCAQLLSPFFQHVYHGDWQSAEKVQQQISKLEKQADVVKRDLRTKSMNRKLSNYNASIIMFYSYNCITAVCAQ